MSSVIVFGDEAAVGNNDGTTWADAYTSNTSALIDYPLRGEVYLDKDSATTSNDYNLGRSDDSGESLRANHVISVDKATNQYSPTPKDGSGVAHFAANDPFGGTFRPRCFTHFRGIHIKTWGALSWGQYHDMAFIDCLLHSNYGSPNSLLGSVGVNTTTYPRRIYAENTKFLFEGQSANWMHNTYHLKGCEVIMPQAITYSGTYPRAAFQLVSTHVVDILMEDCDLSGINLPVLFGTEEQYQVGGSPLKLSKIRLVRCKLAVGYFIYSVDTGLTTQYPLKERIEIVLEGCSTAALAYFNERINPYGHTTTETATYLTSGYRELDGGVNLAEQITPTVEVSVADTIDSFPLSTILVSVGTMTFTVEMLENYTVPLTNKDIRFELSYANDPASAQQTTSSTLDFTDVALSPGAGLAAWTNPPAGYRSVKLSLTVNIGRVGAVQGQIKLGIFEAGKSVYLDKMMVIS